jgi:hypothetical protein
MLMPETERLSLEDFARRIISAFRAHGVRVINKKGEDFQQADIEALVKEILQ